MTLLDVLPWAIAFGCLAAALWFLGAYLRAAYRVEEAKEAERATAARLRTALAEFQAAQENPSHDELLQRMHRSASQLVLLVVWADETDKDTFTSWFKGHPIVLADMVNNGPELLDKAIRRHQAKPPPPQGEQFPPGDQP